MNIFYHTLLLFYNLLFSFNVKFIFYSHQPTTWVLKTPQHSLHLKSIQKIFPHAIVVMTYRNSKDILKSLLPLLSYAAGVQNERVDLNKFGEKWVDRLTDILQQQKIDVNLFPNAIHATFETFIQNEKSQMELLTNIVKQAGLSYDEESMRPVLEFVRKEREIQKGGSRTRFRYDLDVFGVKENAVEEKLKVKK